MSQMLDLIRKRHAGDAWIVISELAERVGYVGGRADAVALGVWPSQGLPLHGFEIKISRGDAKRELADPSKSDAIGRYCDFWWLTISDLDIIDGLVIPETWGILVPKNGVLRVHKKAPKLKAKPLDRTFVASMVRKVTKTWVPKHEHEALKETAHQQAREALARNQSFERGEMEDELKQLKKALADFETASGIKIERYTAGRIGEAAKMVMDLRYQLGENAMKQQILNLDRSADHHQHVADRARDAAAQLRKLIDAKEQTELDLPEVPQLSALHG